jgi:hypothetical protein
MTKPLTDHAMLASLNISQWSARKHDKSVTAEVDKAHAAKDGGRYNKLLIDKLALDPADKIANAARIYHYKVTLPWGDNGDRLLPATLFMDYTATLRQFRTEFEQRVAELVRDYPRLKTEARVRLGTMYNANDYPSDIRDRFQFSTSFSPVPTANDFRVNLSAEHIDYIKADITARITARQADAVKDVWGRVRKVVSKIHEQTNDEDRKIYDSVIENARELIELLPALNLTNDPNLAAIEQDVRALLVPPDRLRQDKRLRADTAKAADAILARLPWA